MTVEQNKIYAHFKVCDPIIAERIKKIKITEWFKPKPKDAHELFLLLCRIIVGQQLSGKAANSIYAKFCTVFKAGNPTPKEVLSIEPQKLRDSGLSWAKVKYVIDLAQHFVDKKIKFSELGNLDDEQVIEELTQVKGIGRWSAEMYLIFTLHRPDVFSYGDLGLNKGIKKLYSFKKMPTTKQIQKIIDNGHRIKVTGRLPCGTA